VSLQLGMRVGTFRNPLRESLGKKFENLVKERKPSETVVITENVILPISGGGGGEGEIPD
jgi:hypothetical protein